MVRLWDKVLKKLMYIDEFDPTEEISDRYDVMKGTGQKDMKGIDLYVGDIVLHSQNVAFHEIYTDRVLTNDEYTYDDNEKWEKIGDIYTGKLSSIRLDI